MSKKKKEPFVMSVPCEVVEDKQRVFEEKQRQQIMKHYTSTKTSANLAPVKVVVMHSGINLNQSNIPDEAVEEAKETLQNIPLLGHLIRDEDGNVIDFGGHDFDVKADENGNYRMVYQESPFGVIPETNNYHIEEIDGKNYVVVEGFIWKNYANEGYDILLNSDKKVSMEIWVEDYEIDEDSDAMTITQFTYLGVTVLGEDNPPAMGDNCTVQLVEESTEKEQSTFSMEEICKEVAKYLEEVNFMKKSEDFALSVENMAQNIRVTLSQRKIEKKYSWSDGSYETQEFYLRTIIPEDNIAVLEDNSANTYGQYVGVPFEQKGDNIALDFDKKEQYIEVWRKQELGVENAIVVYDDGKAENQEIINEQFKLLEDKLTTKEATVEELNNSLTEIKEEMSTKDTKIQELTQFKVEKDKEALETEVASIIGEFSNILVEEDYKEVKEKALANEITLEDFKFNLFALKGMKVDSDKQPTEPVKEEFAKKEEEPAKISPKNSEDFSEENFSSVEGKYGSYYVEQLREIASRRKK